MNKVVILTLSLFFIFMDIGRVQNTIQAQTTSSVAGLWVTEIGGSDGWLLREDGTGLFIRRNESTAFTYKMRENYLIRQDSGSEAEELFKVTNTGELLILEYVSDGFLQVLVNRDVETLSTTEINNDTLTGTWLRWTDMSLYTFSENTIVGFYPSGSVQTFEISGSTIIFPPQVEGGVSAIANITLINDNHLILVFNNTEIIFFSRQNTRDETINIDYLYGVWRGVVSNVTARNGGWQNDLSNHYFEFRTEGIATFGSPQGVFSFDITDRSLVISNSVVLPEPITLNIKYLDENVLVLQDDSEEPIIKIVAYKVALETSEVGIFGELEGTWIGQNRFTVYSDGSTDGGQQVELVGNAVVVSDTNNTNVQNIFRLDDYFLVFENQTNVGTIFYTVYSRMRE